MPSSFISLFSSHPRIHSFPTRRSSDLPRSVRRARDNRRRRAAGRNVAWFSFEELCARPLAAADRKSTRLNSSHVSTSYAVFCLKKKIEGRALARSVRAEESGHLPRFDV